MDKFSARAGAGTGTGTGDGTRSWRQDQKLRKKLRKKMEEKKAEEEAEDEGRRTRRKRFTDPETPFGQKSLVYQLKYGNLKDVAADLPIKQPVQPRSFREARQDRDRVALTESDNPVSDQRPDPKERGSYTGHSQSRSDFSGRDGPPGRGRHGSDFPSRDGPPGRDGRRSDFAGGDRRSGFGHGDRRPFGNSERRSGFGNSERRSGFGNSERRPGHDRQRFDEKRNDGDDSYDSITSRAPRKELMDMTIKYTTAASQFLYGKSVVKAALEQRRRKLYNLYIYGGENRQDSKDNTIMTRLAQKNKIPITIVPNAEQRLMDKMSKGRPHNGFVLEASPLPQLPVRSLGKVEETPTRLGFHVEMDHQTREEESINGTDSFVRRGNDVMPKPFVLLLNEILDPGNLGAILRTASYLGVDAVGITSRGSSTLTPVALKSAAGAVEEISLFTVDDPLTFIEGSREAGWKTYAAVAPPDRKLVRKHGDKFISTDTIEANSPLNDHACVLVLGNEGHGLSKDLKMAADFELSVPKFVQGSCVDSLNVSVAAGLLCHSFVKDLEGSDKTVTIGSPKVVPAESVPQQTSKPEGIEAHEKVFEEVSEKSDQVVSELNKSEEIKLEAIQTEEAKAEEAQPEETKEEKKLEEKKKTEDELVF